MTGAERTPNALEMDHKVRGLVLEIGPLKGLCLVFEVSCDWDGQGDNVVHARVASIVRARRKPNYKTQNKKN